jgi:hypothetical protein
MRELAAMPRPYDPPTRGSRTRRPRRGRRGSVVDALVGAGGEVHRRDVLGEQRGDELASAGDADLLEDGLDVAADGVEGEEEPLGDLGGAASAVR